MTATTPFPFLSFDADNDTRTGLKMESEADNGHWLGQDKTKENLLRQADYSQGFSALTHASANTGVQSMQDFLLQGMGPDAFNSSAMSSNSSQESQSQDRAQWSSSNSQMPFLNLHWQQQAHLGSNSSLPFPNSFLHHPRQYSYTSKSEDNCQFASSSASPPFSLKHPQPTRSSIDSLWQRRLTSKHQSLEGYQFCPSVPLPTNISSDLYGQATKEAKDNDSCRDCNHLNSFSNLESMNPTAAALVDSVSNQSDKDHQSSAQSLLPPRHSSWDSMVASSNTFDPSILQGASWMAGHHSLNSHSSMTSDISTGSSSFPTTHLSPSHSSNTERDMGEEEISEGEDGQDVDEDKHRHKSARSKQTPFTSASSSSASKGVINKVVTGAGGETRHLCPHAGCSKTFSTSGHARRHSRIHSSLRPFQCSSCSSTFSRRDNCVSHERSRHGNHKH